MTCVSYRDDTESPWCDTLLYGWLAGTWPFGVVEGVWALVALRRWWVRRSQGKEQALS
jgi:hypothetical protein